MSVGADTNLRSSASARASDNTNAKSADSVASVALAGENL